MVPDRLRLLDVGGAASYPPDLTLPGEATTTSTGYKAGSGCGYRDRPRKARSGWLVLLPHRAWLAGKGDWVAMWEERGCCIEGSGQPRVGEPPRAVAVAAVAMESGGGVAAATPASSG